MRKLPVFFLHTNAALEVKNRVQFAWAKSQHALAKAGVLSLHCVHSLLLPGDLPRPALVTDVCVSFSSRLIRLFRVLSKGPEAQGPPLLPRGA